MLVPGPAERDAEECICRVGSGQCPHLVTKRRQVPHQARIFSMFAKPEMGTPVATEVINTRTPEEPCRQQRFVTLYLQPVRFLHPEPGVSSLRGSTRCTVPRVPMPRHVPQGLARGVGGEQPEPDYQASPPHERKANGSYENVVDDNHFQSSTASRLCRTSSSARAKLSRWHRYSACRDD